MASFIFTQNPTMKFFSFSLNSVCDIITFSEPENSRSQWSDVHESDPEQGSDD